MGIRGLTGFIDRNHHLLQEYELHNCNVVIDGNNLYHFLYHARHVRCNFGGDYDVYRKKLISTFESFKVCGITPYVVLDGAYTKDGRKLKTSLSRAAARIRLVDAMVNVDRGQALPCLAFETFMQVLVELEIPHVVCQFEADNEIAVLANRMSCPVISNDSDFYIFDLTGGFLPLDYIDFNPLHRPQSGDSNEVTFLSCRRYNVDDFINSFDGLSRSVLPVFASMLGNDYINPGAFESFYARFKVPKIVSKKYHLSPKLSKVISVLHWLHTSCDHEDSSVEEKLFTFVKPNRQDKVFKLFQASVNGYKDVKNFSSFNLEEFFESKKNRTASFNILASEDFVSYTDESFPDWFIKAAANGELSPHILNCSVLHRVIILCQVEDLRLPSSSNCSKLPRQVLYGILLKDSHSESSCSVEIKQNSFLENVNSSCSERKKNSCSDSVDESVDSSCTRNQNGSCLMSKNILSSPGTESEAVSQLLNYPDKQDVTYDQKDSPVISEQVLDKEEEPVFNEGTLEDEEIQVVDEIAEKVHESLDPKTQTKTDFVEEYNRLGKGIQKCRILPIFVVNGIQVPGLKELECLTLEQRRKVLCASLGVTDSCASSFGDNFKHFAFSLIMWISNSEPQVSALHLDCAIVCAVVLKALSHLEKLRKKEKGLMVGENKDTIITGASQSLKQQAVNIVPDLESFLVDGNSVQCDLIHLQHVQKSIEKYHKHAPSFNKRHSFEPDIVHAFSQLQACIVDSLHLNKLLGLPFPSVKPAECMNGTLLYNLYSDLVTRPRPDLFLASLLGNDSWLHSEYLRVKDCIVNSVRESCLLQPSTGNRQQRKGRKRKTNSSQKQREVNKTEGNRKDDEEEMVTQTVHGFDIENKFSLLSVEG